MRAEFQEIDRRMPGQLVLSKVGLDHIKRYEGFRARAYDDLRPNVEIGPETRVTGTLTIGYGHTGRYAQAGHEISEPKAEQLLIAELVDFEAGIKRLVRVPVSQAEFDALVSFAYNVGLGAFERSTLLRKLLARDYDGAAMEFERWVYSKGRKLRGLVLRRVAEASMFRGLSSFSLVDIGALARQADELLGIGSARRPDAIEERGVVKPVAKSKTIWTAGGGMIASVIGYTADLDPRIQLALLVCAFGYLIFNRWLEHRAGEH